MKKTWMPPVAGALNITVGVVGVILAFGLMLASIAVEGALDFAGVSQWIPVPVVAILWLVTVPLFICAGLALVSGIFEVQRKVWGLALAGSIAALMLGCICGLVSLILTALSRDEFERVRVPAPVNPGKTGQV